MAEEVVNPWQTLATKDIYKNPWIQVREDQVINPKGGNGIYGVVSFKNKALGIIPIDEEMNTWLVGQYRYPLDEYSWEIPMGGGLLEKDILESAKRELKEETGFTAAKWTKVCRLHTSNSVTDERATVFLAWDLVQGAAAPDPTERLELRRLPLTEAFRMVASGEIRDGLSVISLQAVQLMYLENRLPIVSP